MIAVIAYRPPEDAFDPGIRERIMPHLVAYSATRKEFGMAWRNQAMDPPRRELTHLIRKGIARRELRSKLDLELSLAQLLGPAIYWHIFLKRPNLDSRLLAEFVVDAFWSRFGLKRSK